MSLRIPARHANLAFAFLMSLQMAAIMSGIITAVNRGLGAGYFAAWAHSFAVAWPIAFPLIAGSGTLTTIISLKANYTQTTVLVAILLNLVIVYIVLKSLTLLERLLGPAGLIAVRTFFGVVLLAIAVKIFATNAHGLIK